MTQRPYEHGRVFRGGTLVSPLIVDGTVGLTIGMATTGSIVSSPCRLRPAAATLQEELSGSVPPSAS
jgi:hypothetical protein